MALDNDGYPLQESLDSIKNFDLLAGLRSTERIPGKNYNENLFILLCLIRESWKWPDRGFRVRKSGRLYLITGGWSGNEDVLSSLNRNPLFTGQYWMKSERGGKHTFEIPRLVAVRLIEEDRKAAV